MEQKVEFSKNVLLIDAAFVNGFVASARQSLSEHLGRELPLIDLPTWLACLTLDAGLVQGENEVQVIWVHDEATRELSGCEPGELPSLNGMACRTPMGEFLFSCVTPAGITGCGDLFVDLTAIALDAAGVECLMLLPYEQAYGDYFYGELGRLLAGKEEAAGKVACFGVQFETRPAKFRRVPVIGPLVYAWGLRSDAL